MMEKVSEISGSSESKSMENVAYLGTILTLPMETTVDEGSFENKTRVAFSDKQTGSYGRATTTEKVSAGDFQWKNGKSGKRNEYKETSTIRIGDKNGYIELSEFPKPIEFRL
ncbi:unnamed protein product [Lactuca saligna]|uniref:Uncharacterized protein n=1 Tax=Lactuca saligna TaxID=75948 RepID=A0AA36EJA1_LACSI|nr:unnamed protein product [Lactuca saligna]